jgi:upstream activation factor subunit UAF30
MGKRSSKSKRGSVKREKKESEEQAKNKDEEAVEEEEEKIEPKKPNDDKKKKKTKKSKSKSVKREKKSRKEESNIKEEEGDDEEKEEPTDEALRAHIRRLIPLVNLQNTGVKAFTKLLSKECGGADLKPRMKFIKVALSEAINALDDDGEEEEKKKPRKTGLSVKKEISAELASFLGKGPSELVARTDIVKGMWDYIKANELQNPENKREIFLDKKMKKVFGCDTFTMFTMNKYLGAHIHPFKPVDLTTNTTKKKKPGTPGRKRKKRAGDDDSDNDSGEDRSKKKRKPKKPGLQPPYRLSKELADLVGTNILPRPQVVKGIWAYIKKQDLQNPKDKREILCDGKLKKIMGGKDKVTMFNMNRYVTDHLLEKLDRSEYNHDETEAELQARDEELEL